MREGREARRRVRRSGLLSDTLSVGDPTGFEVCHTCDNPPCVNPSHLFKGTRLDNVRDMYHKNRSYDRNGEGNSRAKLTEIQAREILQKLTHGSRRDELAKEFSVSKGTIAQLAQGRTWKNIPRGEIA